MQGGQKNDVHPAATDDETMAQVGVIVNSITLPMTMRAAIDLGLLEIISGEQQTAAEVVGKLLAKEYPQAEETVERILRHLAAFSVVSSSVKVVGGGETRKVYGLTPVGRYFVKNEEGVSMSPLLSLITDKVFLESWYKLKDGVLEGGIPFNMVHGMNAFEYPGVDPRFNEVFNLAMFGHTSIIMRKIMESYKGLENTNVVVDVGGGLGLTLKIILSKYPNMKGINFDLPHVLKDGLSHPGMEHVGGDMFDHVPNADAIFMKWILHDWSDEHCLKLLKNCYRAIPQTGKVIVVEYVVPEEAETSTVAKAVSTLDIVMLTQNPGGKERTKKEYLGLAMAAGFAGIRFECYICNFWVMELYK